MEKKNFKKISFVQIPIVILLGSVINFFLYNILGNVTFDSYVLKIIILVLGTVWVSFVLSVILVIGKPTFPNESFFMAVHRGMKMHYSKFRQIIDIVLIGIVVIVTLLFRIPWTLREGTVILAVLFGPLLGLFMPRMEKFFENLGIIEGKSEIEKLMEGEE